MDVHSLGCANRGRFGNGHWLWLLRALPSVSTHRTGRLRLTDDSLVNPPPLHPAAGSFQTDPVPKVGQSTRLLLRWLFDARSKASVGTPLVHWTVSGPASHNQRHGRPERGRAAFARRSDRRDPLGRGGAALD